MDTCGAESTLALAQMDSGALRLLRNTVLAPRTAGSLLTGAIRDLLHPIAPCELNAIIIARGPGSFTGMRIGLSAAKALAEACSAPLFAVSRLAVLAQIGGSALVALDAGRGSVYLRSPAAMEDAATEKEERLLTAELARMEAARFPQEVLTVCESKVQALFPEARLMPAPRAFDAIRCAQDRLCVGDWDDTATLDALYLWRAEQMLTSSTRQR